MSLIAQPLRPMAEFMSPIIEAGDTFYDILYTPCEWHTFCSMDIHPLTDNVDFSAYAKSVDGDRTAVKHFKALNEL